MLIENSLVERVDSRGAQSALGGEDNLPVIIAFCAKRCGPCKVLEPQLELVAMTERGRLRVLKLDTEESDENAAFATKFQIRALPTIVWMSPDGSLLQRGEGPLSSKMIRAIAEHRFFDGPEPAGAPQRANVVIEDMKNESAIL